jgi:hypothetical protein
LAFRQDFVVLQAAAWRAGSERKLGNPGRLNYVADPGGNAEVRWRHDLSARNRSRIMYFGGSFADRKF